MTYGDQLREAEEHHALEDETFDQLALRATRAPMDAIVSTFSPRVQTVSADELARRRADLDSRCRARGERR